MGSLDLWEMPQVQLWPRSQESTGERDNCVRVDDVTYCVGQVAGQSRICLYRLLGDEPEPVGYFPDRIEAEIFRDWLLTLCEAAKHGTVERMSQ